MEMQRFTEEGAFNAIEDLASTPPRILCEVTGETLFHCYIHTSTKLPIAAAKLMFASCQEAMLSFRQQC